MAERYSRLDGEEMQRSGMTPSGTLRFWWWLSMPSYIGVPFRTREDEKNNGKRHLGNAVLCGPHFESTDCGVSLICHGMEKPWHAYTRNSSSSHWFERFADRAEAMAAVERHYLSESKRTGKNH